MYYVWIYLESLFHPKITFWNEGYQMALILDWCQINDWIHNLVIIFNSLRYFGVDFCSFKNKNVIKQLFLKNLTVK